MTAVIHDTMSMISAAVGCICVLGAIIFVNYAFSRDKVVTRTMKHQG